jgi:Zn-dependent M28 family amino/carboxypeptidase
MRTLILPVLLVCLLAVSCSNSAEKAAADDKPSTTASVIDVNLFKTHIQKLSADEMEGRAPGGKGEDLATAYIADYMKSIGLKTQMQAVPLVGVNSTPSPLKITGTKPRDLKYGDEFVAWTKQQKDSLSVSGDLVFAGYGVVAPEFDWNDFKDSVKGKVIVVLVNDPQLDDPKMFGGKAMTYYGRWTYKFEEAARQGAAGALIVHETEFAGYPWEVVRGSWSGEQFDMVRPDKGASVVPLSGWITHEVAGDLFKAAGFDFAEMKKKALERDFKPIPLKARASIQITNKMRTVDSKNVIGVLEGQTPDEYVVLTAHWDHLGVGEAQNGDKIYNGAVDNASGVAMMLDIARALTKAPKPRRSIAFIAVTAEEQGLLGSQYYAENPVFPLNKTLGDINIDEANVFGPNNEITAIGYGYTTLEDVLREVAAEQGRKIVAEGEPEKGFYYRSDQFSFAKHGVPGLYTKTMTVEASRKFDATNYHKPSDQYDPNWNMAGAVQDGDAFYQVTLRVANADKWPEWKPGTEFKAIREKSLAQQH